MTEPSTITYKRQKKPRYPRRIAHVHSGSVFLKLLDVIGTPKRVQRRSHGSPLEWKRRLIRVAELNDVTRMMLRSAGQVRHDWRDLGAEELLARINNPRLTQRDQEMAVLFAETTAFGNSQRPRLLAELAAFIAANRFTPDANGITAICSAVRKYAMNMDEAHFELYGGWLRPSDTKRVTSGVELELVKALCWRLTYLPVSAAVLCTGLMAALEEVCNAYLLPRWIVTNNYAAVTLNAVTAIAILQALSGDRRVISAILERVSALGIDWFSEALDDGLQESYEVIDSHDPQLAERLRQLIGSEW